MEDAADALAVLAQDVQRVAVGFAVMDDDGYVEFHSQFDHVDEDGLLDIPGRFRPVIIQADFADGDDFLFRLYPLAQLVDIAVLGLGRFFGMDADGGIKTVVFPGHGDALG